MDPVASLRPVDHQLQENLPLPLSTLISSYLMAAEGLQICEQLKSKWLRNRQVLWHGVSMTLALKWADEHDMQTLSTVMGPLRDPSNPACPKYKKSSEQWCN